MGSSGVYCRISHFPIISLPSCHVLRWLSPAVPLQRLPLWRRQRPWKLCKHLANTVQVGLSETMEIWILRWFYNTRTQIYNKDAYTVIYIFIQLIMLVKHIWALRHPTWQSNMAMEQPNPHMSTCYGQLSSNQNMVVFMDFREFMRIISSTYSGWWFQPLWKIWVRQLGVLFPIYSGTKNMFETTRSVIKCYQLITLSISYYIHILVHMSDGYNPYKLMVKDMSNINGQNPQGFPPRLRLAWEPWRPGQWSRSPPVDSLPPGNAPGDPKTTLNTWGSTWASMDENMDFGNHGFSPWNIGSYWIMDWFAGQFCRLKWHFPMTYTVFLLKNNSDLMYPEHLDDFFDWWVFGFTMILLLNPITEKILNLPQSHHGGWRFSPQKIPWLVPWDGAIFILTQDMDIHHGCDMDSPCFSKLIWDI